MKEKNLWSMIGLFLVLAILSLILGIRHYIEGNSFLASLYFFVVVVLLSASLMGLIADRWYREKQGSFKVVVLVLYAIVPIVFVLIPIGYVGDPTLTLIAGIILGVFIGLVAFILILRRRSK
jgi:hypothetical protein